MKNLKRISFLFLIGIMFSFSAFAADLKPIDCKNFRGLPLEVKKQILALDDKFEWNSSNCKIVGTKSIFARNAKFEKGLQLFIYQNNKLKFICLPGWVCKAW